MVSSFFLALLLASVTCTLVRADVSPLTPNAADAGSTCTITWAGDTNSTSGWSNMAIEFMTGDNFDMVFLTTVATGLDGTKDGIYHWICPEVNPYSAIYFYEFTSPSESSNPQWTTRFAIASPSGNTTTPPNSTQPDGEKIPWGKGVLLDTSGSAAPSFASGITSGSVPVTSVVVSTASSGSTAATSVVAPTSSSGPTAATSVVGYTSAAGANQVSSTTDGGDSASTSGANDAAATGTSTSSNSGLGLVVEERVWTSAFGVVASAMALALFM